MRFNENLAYQLTLKVVFNDSVIDSITELAPHKTQDKIQKYFEKCLEQLEFSQKLNGIGYIALDKCRKTTGWSKAEGKKLRVWDICQEHIGFFIVHEKGNNIKKKLTEVSINPKYLKILKENIMGQTNARSIELAPHKIRDVKQVNIPVIIDRDAITKALLQGEYWCGQLHIEIDGKTEAQLKKLLENSTSDGILAQNFVQLKTGRLYTKKGTMSLQSITKKARNIAVPQHRIFDLDSACFSYFYGLYHTVTGQTLTSIEHYINNTEKVRLAVTKDISDNYRDENNYKKLGFITRNATEYGRVKAAFTAIGFGATLNGRARWQTQNGNWEQPALASILGPYYNQFMSNFLVDNFLKDLKHLKKFILSIKDQFPLYNGVELDDTLSEAQTLAYIYQAQERYMLDILYEQANGNVIAIMHDGVMTPTDIDYKDIRINMQDAILKSCNMKMKVSHDRILSYTENIYDDKIKQEKHHMLIAQQEQLANEYISPHISDVEFNTSKDQKDMYKRLTRPVLPGYDLFG